MAIKLVNHGKFLKYLAKTFTSAHLGRERIMYVNNKWRVNPMPRFEALYCFFLQKYGERHASQIAQKIDQLAQHINSESQDLTIKALVLSEAKTNQKHKVYINLAQNDNTYGILTDYNNARRHAFYKREQIIEKLTIKKDSTILAADKSEFEIASPREINENSSSIIW